MMYPMTAQGDCEAGKTARVRSDLNDGSLEIGTIQVGQNLGKSDSSCSAVLCPDVSLVTCATVVWWGATVIH